MAAERTLSDLEITVSEDPAAAVAELLVAAMLAGGDLVLAGGSSPKRAYGLAAQADGDFSGATLWLGDERMVAPDDPLSNLSMIEQALIEPLAPERRPQLIAVDTTLPAADAAADYDSRLQSVRPDLVLLGLGPDAHTASLFPGKPAVRELERLAVAVPEAGMEPYVERVTMTLPMLNRGRSVVFLIVGGEKTEAVARAFGPNADPALSPAAAVRPARLICDEAARP